MLRDDGLSLVPLSPRHLALTLDWANNPTLSHLLNRANPVTAAEHEAWFAAVRTRRDCAYFAVEETVEHALVHVGNVWLWDIDDRHRKAELRIVIGEPAARGRGLGTRAIDLLCQYGFAERRLHRIYAYVLSLNPPARHAFENAGFTLEGTLRDDRWIGDRFCDAWILGRVQPPAVQ